LLYENRCLGGFLIAGPGAARCCERLPCDRARCIDNRQYGEALADPAGSRVWIEPDTDDPRIIVTEPGIGYRIAEPAR
jgi:hypothetical protein